MLALADAPEETDDGPPGRRGGRARATTTRTCIATRTAGPPAQMIRFVVDPAGAVVPDIAGRLPGRGAWVMAQRSAVETAVRRKAFARAFKREVQVDAALADQVDALLGRAAVAALSLANKAGALVLGYAKVEAACAAGGVAALVHAAEAGADGVEKLGRALARGAGGPRPPVVNSFTGGELDLALGRSNVIHAALLAGPASNGFLARSKRLEDYRSGARPGRHDGR